MDEATIITDGKFSFYEIEILDPIFDVPWQSSSEY